MQILVFGEQLLALGEEGDELFIWNIASTGTPSFFPTLMKVMVLSNW